MEKFDHIPEQGYFLYPSKWKAPFDQHLINCLLLMKVEVHPTPPHKSPHAQISALSRLNDHLGTNFVLIDVEERVEFLEIRYNTFRALTLLPDTQWEPASNMIFATDEVWERIFKENDLAKAYLRGGDPCYTQLCDLFGADNVKHELSHTVILISDSPQVKKHELSHTVVLISDSPQVKKLELIEVGDSSSDEEVNSPIDGPNKNVVRKLTFVSGQVAHSTTDAMSSVGPSGGRPYAPWLKIESKLQVPVKPTDVGDNNILEGSSCASCSPFK